MITSSSPIAQVVADYVAAMLEFPETFRGQQLRGGGPVTEFEMLLAERTGFPYCLATSNATSALLVAGLALNLAGKRIAVELGAWDGSLGALEASGAEILEVISLLSAPLEGVSAVLAVDSGGNRHDAAGLRVRCDKAGITYIEDTGWLPGFTAPCGDLSLADIQIISFGPGKPVCIGEGGAILCRTRATYESTMLLCQHPERIIAAGMPRMHKPSLNCRIHPLAAVLGVHLLRQNQSFV